MRSKINPVALLISACVVLAALAGSRETAWGQTGAAARAVPKSASAGPLLGSLDFKPSPQRPVGWRGDFTGRYPGATPPTEWGRWAKTSLRDMRCQGAKPKVGGSDSGDVLPFGRIENWLVIGPFAADDLAKGLEAELIAKESELRPDAGQKAGAKTWTAFKAGGKNQHGGSGQSGVEFFHALDKTTGVFGSYAHTNLYSPQAAAAVLHMGMPTGMKIWLNGKLICTEPKSPYAGRKEIPVELSKGWNSLLCKGVYNIQDEKNIGQWRFTATLAPAEKSFSYETRNVAWMTPLPSASTAIPVIVGDRIFIASNYFDLLCINKSDGKVLWLRSNDFYDCMTEAEKAAKPGLKDKLAPVKAKLDALNEEIVQELNSSRSSTGLPSGQYRTLAAKLEAKARLARDVENLLRENRAIKRTASSQHIGTSNGTPVSDGQRVWAVFGGGIYSGPLTVVCYDLTGKRLWARAFSDVDAAEHGDHCSPLLVAGRLVVPSASKLQTLDAQTGSDIWSIEPSGFSNNGGGSYQHIDIGGQPVLVGPRLDMYRLQDGQAVFVPDAQNTGTSVVTPVIQDNVVYQLVGWTERFYSAFRFPAEVGKKLAPKQLYRVPVGGTGYGAPDGPFINSFVASPLYVDGLVYCITEGGVLHVSEADTGKPVYVRMLDEMHPRVQWVFHPGVCASPTLAGKHIYLTDDNGTTLVLQPGREYKPLAVNTLENFADAISPEPTMSSPVFEGKFMYYRTPGYLYCIGAK